MPLEEVKNYVAPNYIKNIENEEEKIKFLLEDVRTTVASLLRPDVANERWEAVSDAIEKGKWILKNLNPPHKDILDRALEKTAVLYYSIDLSQAKEIIDNYKHLSEKGCEYCENLGKFEDKGKTGSYCKIGETEKKIDWFPISDNNSLKIREFAEKPCSDRTSALRPLEEILREMSQNSVE